MLATNDAALIIGDPGMTFPRGGLNVWDMAGLWRQHTGLGFVFAMWMVRSDCVTRLQAVDFARARDEGLEHLEEIVVQYQSSLSLSPEEIREYLTRNIAFHIDIEMAKGLQRYFELAGKHELIAKVRPMRFVERT
jgi:chorismate dehydratase